MQQLQYMKEMIAEKLNQRLKTNTVKNIFFVVGQVNVETVEDESKPTAQSSAIQDIRVNEDFLESVRHWDPPSFQAVTQRLFKRQQKKLVHRSSSRQHRRHFGRVFLSFLVNDKRPENFNSTSSTLLLPPGREKPWSRQTNGRSASAGSRLASRMDEQVDRAQGGINQGHSSPDRRPSKSRLAKNRRGTQRFRAGRFSFSVRTYAAAGGTSVWRIANRQQNSLGQKLAEHCASNRRIVTRSANPFIRTFLQARFTILGWISSPVIDNDGWR